MQQHSKLKTPSKKDWLKFIDHIDDPYLCEALIVQLEARKDQLGSDFRLESPKR